jgi:TonB-dependent SusC/RagA subfamily outer membrane receptor
MEFSFKRVHRKCEHINGITKPKPAQQYNPNDIENIEVLKDADATAIYGQGGANGGLNYQKKGSQGTKHFSNCSTAVGTATNL